MENLSDASYLGKLLVLPVNVRLDWKVLPGPNTLAYLASSSATKKKSFITFTNLVVMFASINDLLEPLLALPSVIKLF